MKVYIIIGQTGMYEEHQKWLSKVFTTKSLAEAHLKRFQGSGENLGELVRMADGGLHQDYLSSMLREFAKKPISEESLEHSEVEKAAEDAYDALEAAVKEHREHLDPYCPPYCHDQAGFDYYIEEREVDQWRL